MLFLIKVLNNFFFILFLIWFGGNMVYKVFLFDVVFIRILMVWWKLLFFNSLMGRFGKNLLLIIGLVIFCGFWYMG